MITEQTILDAGYKEYPVNFNSADKLFQRTIRKEGIKLYFINIYQYNLTKYDKNLPIKFEFEVRFYQTEVKSFDLRSFQENFESLAEMEDFYAKVYKVMECIPDVHNN